MVRVNQAAHLRRQKTGRNRLREAVGRSERENLRRGRASTPRAIHGASRLGPAGRAGCPRATPRKAIEARNVIGPRSPCAAVGKCRNRSARWGGAASAQARKLADLSFARVRSSRPQGKAGTMCNLPAGATRGWRGGPRGQSPPFVSPCERTPTQPRLRKEIHITALGTPWAYPGFHESASAVNPADEKRRPPPASLRFSAAKESIMFLGNCREFSMRLLYRPG